MSTEKEVTTSVQEVDIETLDEILGTSAETIMTAEEGEAPEKNKTIFSSMEPDTSFLDKAEVEKPADETEEDSETKKGREPLTRDSVDEALKMPEETEEEEVLENKGGRPTALVAAAKNMIESGLLVPFQNDKGEDESIENYTAKDFEELIQANIKSIEDNVNQQVPQEFFQQLPPEMQQAYEYIASGGTDMKGMFAALAQTQEITELDITKEQGQKYAIRTYLQATNYGTPEEIEDEINSLEDRGDLEKKAKQFKPKLDNMQQQIVQQKIAQQQEQQKQRAQQSQKYIESVYSALEPGDLNGLKMDNRTQNMLYAGLVQSNYPSISGKQTNMLGHLLEKYQWVEPRHDLIAEALWLLADPDGYKNNLSQMVKQEVDKETMKSLKTEQATKGRSTSSEMKTSGGKSLSKRTAQRPKRNFFGR